MMGGLGSTGDPTAASGQYRAMGFSPGFGSGSAGQPADAPATTSNPADPAEFSHLDSFFESSGWTREDVVVLAALANVMMFAILLAED